MPSTGSSRASMPGHQPAHGAGMVGLDLVGGHHRRGFGDAIAFQQITCRISCAGTGAGLVAHPLGAAHRHAQTVQLAGLADAGILVDESVGGEQDGGAMLADAAHDFACGCSGVGWQTTFTPAISGRMMPHHQAEAMEGGQGIEQHIAGVKIDMGAHLGDIGQDDCHGSGPRLWARLRCRR